jgi:hypothetical protein
MKYILITIILVIIISSFFMLLPKQDVDVNEPSSSDNSSYIEPLELEGEKIEFMHSDDNTGEDILIMTDKAFYEGDSWADVYIGVSNMTDIDQKAALLFHFSSENKGDDIATIKESNGDDWNYLTFFRENIKINESALDRALLKREMIPSDFEVRSGTQINIPAKETVYLLARLEYTPGASGEFWVEALGNKGAYGLLDPVYGTTVSADTTAGWFSNGATWTIRRKITINSDEVSGSSNFTNFPILISATLDDWRDTSNGGNVQQSNGQEFAFTSSDGTTQLDHEIEGYDPVTGELIVWVEIPTLLATTETIIYMYYGSAAAADQENATGTWNSGYQAVYHMDQDPSINTDGDCGGSTDEICDSTSNNNDGDSGGTMTTGDKVSGQVSSSWDFDGSDDYATIADSASLDIPSSFTVSAWVNIRTFAGNGLLTNIFDKSLGTSESAGDNANYGLQIIDDVTGFCTGDCPTIAFEASDGGDNSAIWDNSGISASTWYYLAGVFDDSANTLTLYSDGIQRVQTTGVTDTPDQSSSALEIGDDVDNINSLGQFYDGQIDEVRIYEGVLTADWIATEYNNQNNPRAFYSIGGEENELSANPGMVVNGTNVSTDNISNWYQSGGNIWEYRNRLAINHVKVTGSTNLVNFPVLVSFTDSDLIHIANGGKVASASGGDILFTSSDGTTKIDHEIEGYNSDTGELQAWVEVPTLSTTTDTNIYIYYGGPATGAGQENATGTWNSNYVGVYHLTEDPSISTDGDCGGGTAEACDSTSNSNDGDSSGTMTTGDKIAGQVSASLDFDGSDDYIDITDANSLDITNGTVSAWIKSSTGGRYIISKDPPLLGEGE